MRFARTRFWGRGWRFYRRVTDDQDFARYFLKLLFDRFVARKVGAAEGA